ncbi:MULTISPECIES: RICIN domain-containing protein [unclassified Streptomyces]|uniref:RICIN domain-containing protein n=1 Tax=unclassified Streptomyces TaxID=2593676 RepID=UPI001661CCB2|nr:MULTISPECIES: RICIN domain-containing protein [unclassified Streptomyces]MBD0841790.1 RICIN domain-containing protein [Streptomyces sp. TRM68416]
MSISSTLVRAAALGTSVAALAFLPATTASAADVINTFKNQATNRCIDDTNQGFRTWSCNDSNAQKWIVHKWNDGTVQLKNVNTNRCMYDSDQGFKTLPCDDSRNQSWYVKKWADNTIELKNQATNRCIDDSNVGFRTLGCNAGTFQSWF